MRLDAVFFLVTCLFMVSCKKHPPEVQLQDGTYHGTFKRSYVSRVSNVSLQFSEGSFSGKSDNDSAYYPVICAGTFSASGDSVQFNNACFFTANFDWSYILSGKYFFAKKNDSLVITRSYGGIFYYTDIYTLKRN